MCIQDRKYGKYITLFRKKLKSLIIFRSSCKNCDHFDGLSSNFFSLLMCMFSTPVTQLRVELSILLPFLYYISFYTFISPPSCCPPYIHRHTCMYIHTHTYLDFLKQSTTVKLVPCNKLYTELYKNQ